MPVGGAEYAGVKTCIGQYGTHSYFQSDVRFRGTLEWGDVRDEVEGDSGWIDRQWTPRHLGVHNDRRSTALPPRVAADPPRQRHRDERLAARRPPPRQSPDPVLRRHRGDRRTGACSPPPSSTIERLSFVRDPGLVRPRTPLTRGAEVLRRPLSPAHPGLGARPVLRAARAGAGARASRSSTGAVRRASQGSVGGRAGAAASASTSARCAFARDFELVDVLRGTLRHLPDDAFPTGSPGPLGLANLVWEIDALPQPRRPRRGAPASARARAAAPRAARRAASEPTCCRSPTTSRRRS